MIIYFKSKKMNKILHGMAIVMMIPKLAFIERYVCKCSVNIYPIQNSPAAKKSVHPPEGYCKKNVKSKVAAKK